MTIKMNNMRKIHVGVYDQIVTSGGIRNFEYELMRQWRQLKFPTEVNFTVMWPKFDTIGGKLVWSYDSESQVQIQWIQSNFLHATVNSVIRLISVRGLFWFKELIKKHFQGSKWQFLRSLSNEFEWLLLKARKYDLIYFPNPFRTLPLYRQVSFPKPTVITLHDLAHEITDAWGVHTERIRKEVFEWTRLANGIIFSSEWVRKKAIRLYKIPEEKTFLVYLAPWELQVLPGTQQVNEVLSKYKLPSGYAICLGSASPHKGHITILKGLAVLRDDYGIKIPFVIAGPNTNKFLANKGESINHSHYCEVQNLIHELGFRLGEDLFILGFVPDADVPALYLGSKMVVTASQSEAGLNAMIFDGMWYERPIVCSNIPVFIERVGESGNLAYTFETGDAFDLAIKMRMVIQEPIKTKETVARAKKYVLSRNWTDVANEYINVFRQVLQNCSTIR